MATRRIAKQWQVTMSRALTTSYHGFLAENDPARKNEAGKDLIRSIFGKSSIAEDLLQRVDKRSRCHTG
jgi:hypothetical protein